MPTALHRVSIPAWPALAMSVALAACGPSAETGGPGNSFSAAEANAWLEAAEENAAALARDDDLANEAAADEAADMDVFGGNAAAGETSNGARDLATGNDEGR